ncbi:phosphonoacetaldehyde reductase [Lipingzhangella sp. LS1_29]|uniref:Phosphonoacetaldehyde reductase n=1 Tax=Lipingzhangella rawalii TaxID=2055835 RepID=A0ABU2H7J2_9ACTN|nr:phosphonoacetaldehyde reductase [Lipingzhangella rawalii]MDS1271266.1 phosphonoacetaldehyde reductase [Lipingzhangella rawalii]
MTGNSTSPITGDTVSRDVRYGPGVITATGAAVRDLGGRRVLLVCGTRSFADSGAHQLLEGLEEQATVRRWSQFAPNTDAADLEQGLAVLADFRPDVVLGVGGGSAMDMAKLLCAFAGVADREKLRAAIRSGDPVLRRDPHLVLAPTTSGSGSEATHFAVVYVDGTKYSVSGPQLRPDRTLLDPRLAMSGSPYQRATSGIDAVAQAVESLWSVGATDRSRRRARAALRLLLPAIESFVQEPEERTARAMAVGSHLAGRAIDTTKTTVAHALSYGITTGYGISHGHAVALTLGAFIAEHARAQPRDLRAGVSAEQHAVTMAHVLEAFGATTPAEARDRFVALCHRLGLATSLSELGVPSASAARELAGGVNVERLGNNPVVFDHDSLQRLLDSVY